MYTNQTQNNSAINAATSEGGESLTFKIVKLSLYALIFIISIIGNALVCIVIARRRRMRTVTNYFILNLAIADLAVTCICIPFDIPVQENGYIWPYGPFICKILWPLQTMCLFVSIFTLTAVSLNRFWAIVYPLRRQMTKGNATVVIILIWLLSLVLSTPYVMVLGIKGNYCEETWPNTGPYRKAYTLSIFVFQYLLPLTVISAVYVKIGIELRKCIGPHQTNAALYRAQQEDATKVVRMLIIVTVLFALCVLPNNIMWIWLDFGKGDSYEHFWHMVAVTNIILFANSATNPVAYTICHERFREEFKLYFTCDKRIFSNMQTSVFSRTFKSFRTSNGMDKSTPSTPDENIMICAKETVV
ncbi:neuropeptide FF receptor 2 [Exaiptasia diaphana]|uniref:G-protein coupled receptors family 1 profile domain-containing protein n=1 Tax=Exaiptasia diaphana TaxID=2652724 RepID=A0A913YNA8_EXADI|nr:neuropeptide FF receptor 2 [Exaiptasia diaphana]XP_020907993.1 neuropeptide FF receptor 2 [Exaiptasia diaphana]XP_020907994.1 neuropeptide FF receptor 2 [Exaiptasia diaphana]XP_020907995.1 neuropeptide FF receptor 2 [Exaiptasia diaphana]XP_028516962.1 neuropeptide FF receptor 2 [Exaiptasia diaphana]XP_028516963.1 neuropeptide FF receptor 2 [Exaiptasia diaphana]XP_028516964.1 neuropeptide FF receptor 2 [Exaiptasia diaphana]XP_028516965.1 neuropeptide FF receptor 2 [Exaiptasia diaphana]KXJ